MKAVILEAPERVAVRETERPRLESPGDAVVRVTLSAICGADLLPFHGHTPGFEFGMIPGHEFVGDIVELGPEATGLELGQRVVNTSMTSCGACRECRERRWTQCETRSLFGYSGVYPRLEGGQAEYVRVPNASRSLLALPDAVSPEAALFLADILPTGYAGVEGGGVGEGDLLVVQGAGPVGLMAVLVGLSRGARVLAIDGVDARRRLAETLGATSASPQDARAVVDELSSGGGADCVVEASGSIPALKEALHLVRPQGVVSVIGAHFENDFPLDNGMMFEKELTLKFNIGNPFETRELLLDAIQRGALDPGPVLTHILPADRAEEAYAGFDSKEFTKVALAF